MEGKLLLLLNACLLITNTSADIEVTLHLLSYTNVNGSKQSGKCCDDTSICHVNPCDPRITGCLSSIYNNSNCDVGKFKTDQYIDKNSINFGDKLSVNLRNPITFVYKSRWKETLDIRLKVEDVDSDSHELIDIFDTQINAKVLKNNNKTHKRIEGQVSSIHYTLSFVCAKYFYGNECFTYCKSVPEQYTCNNYGNKVCQDHWFGYNCSQYCKPDTSLGHYRCDPLGNKICDMDWYGKNCSVFCNDRNKHYRCDDSGNKVCSKNYYGPNCEKLCMSDSTSNYLCDKFGAKVCFDSWFGKDCSVKCIEMFRYRCHQNTGARICRENYYGVNCDLFCKANNNDNYQCDKTGRKVCLEHYYGKNCTIYVPFLPRKSAVCAISGNSLVKTFDNKYFTFPEDCTYQLTADCEDDTFAVHMRKDSASDRVATLYLGNFEVTLRKDRVLSKNYSLVLPFTWRNIIIERIDKYVIVKTGNGVSVRWTGNSMYIEVEPQYANKTCGLCGNFNGNSMDEISDRNGHITRSTSHFLDSWKRTKIGDICHFSDEKSKLFLYDLFSTFQYSGATTVCDELKNNPEFRACNSVVDPTPYHAKCSSDTDRCRRRGSDVLTCVCDSFTEYSRECARRGKVYSWRTATLCPIACKSGLAYSECGSTCVKNCQNFHLSLPCPSKCIDGCFCPAGQVIHNGRCTPTAMCPCMHSKVRFESGSEIKRDCNTCKCSHGKWNCTTKQCGGKCSILDPHFKTFDGNRYTFNGACQYLLMKDCVTNSIDVILDTTTCAGDTPAVSCAKTVTVLLNGTTVTLSHHNRVKVNGVAATIPYLSQQFQVKRVSSLFIHFTSALGVEVLYEGGFRVYITVPSSFKNKTCGLCGTFNNNQGDDFRTPERIVNSNALSFGNSWKLNPPCPNQNPQHHPCDVEMQRKSAADKKCGKLRMSPFTQCHSVVDPAPFIGMCRYDVCGCTDPVKCLCGIVASYTKECAEEGVVIEWRNENILPECGVQCAAGLTYQECGNMCSSSCRNLAVTCEEQCVAGCNCPNGTLLDEFGLCVPLDRCQCFDDGVAYPPGYTLTRDTCQKCVCRNGIFDCKRDEHCLDKTCPSNQVYTRGNGECTRTCESAHLPCLRSDNVPGCYCINGTVWDGNACVQLESCPCHRNGRAYQNGTSFPWDCNTCTCEGREWKCTDRKCAGTCLVYGDSHYTTFDGKRFMFEGKCDYVLVQDSCGESDGGFSLRVQNVACGDTGTTCSKKIVLTVNDTALYFERDQNIRAIPANGHLNTTLEYKVIKTTFYVIANTNSGITIMWDGATRITLKLNPTFRGKTCGLCGNFNDNQLDDFTTRQLDAVVNAQHFGDSWKTEASCPDTSTPVHPCSVNENRRAWSHKQCNVINRELFAACHYLVDPTAYYDACFFDACGCDMGGDCECLCTAISAYAEACSRQGVHIKWRSQHLCPIQCETCQEYQACGPSNPQTCTNMCDASLDLPVRCVEGCFCANDTVLHNGKCIEAQQCPCYVDGVEYAPGQMFIQDCQKCVCENGCFKCSGPTCTTPIVPTTPTIDTTTTTSGTTATTTAPETTKPTTQKPITSTTTTTTQPGSTKPTTPITSTTTTTTQPGSTKPSTPITSTTTTTTQSETTKPTTPITSTTTTTGATPTTKVSTQKTTTTTTKIKTDTTAKTTSTTTKLTTKDSTKPTDVVTTKPSTTSVTTTFSTTCKLPGNTTGYQCRNHKKFCISRSDLCDVMFHCPEHDDESSCPTTSTTTAATGGTATPGGGTVHPTTPGRGGSTPSRGTPVPCHGYLCKGALFCINRAFYCDGDPDCPLGDDEVRCDGESTPKPTTPIVTTPPTVPEVTTTKSTAVTTQKPTTKVTTETSTTRVTTNKATPNKVTKDKTTTTDLAPSVTTTSSTTTTTTRQPPTIAPCTLSPYVYMCSSGNQCINFTQVCDGRADCDSGDDEINCPISCAPCSRGNFKCHKACQCTSLDFVCDGSAECWDGSDERGCSNHTTTAPVTTTTSTPVVVTTPTSTKGPSTSEKSTTTTTPVTTKPVSATTKESTTTTSLPTTTNLSTTTDAATTTTETVITTTKATIPACPNNMVYQACHWSCRHICGYLDYKCFRERTCRPGCGCEPGLLNNGTHCVLPSACGCLDVTKGGLVKKYYEAGDYWQRDCEACSCFNNRVVCVHQACPKLFCPPPHRLVPVGCCQKCVIGTLPPVTTPVTTAPPVCRSDEFRCGDDKCISDEWVCDGERDCFDAADERTCSHIKPSCSKAIGVDSKDLIPDSSFTASSYRGTPYRPSFARLNNMAGYMTNAGAWCALRSRPSPHWVQVDLGAEYLLAKVALKSRHMVVQFVKSYTLKYSLNGYSWNTYKYHDKTREFAGNKDTFTKATAKLERKVQARFVRINVKSYLNEPCLRFEMYGCANFTVVPTTLPITTKPITTVQATCREFLCADNITCIVNLWMCNGVPDCPDASDESPATCNKTCTEDEFQCANGHCLRGDTRCDGDRDCSDGSDEVNCTSIVCPNTHYQCPEGMCILRRHVCDGDPDCLKSGADETNCTTPTPGVVTTPAPCIGHTCSVTGLCVPEDFVCDMYKDCVGGEDENCCSKQKFLCPTPLGEAFGRCIPRRTVCDGYNDCEDGFDELNCTATTTTKKPTTRATTKQTTTTTEKTITEITTQNPTGHLNATTGPSTTTTACPRMCLCENTCESLSLKPQGCYQLNCFALCDCPAGYSKDLTNGHCRTNVSCPCNYEGRKFAVGMSLSLKNCSTCLCTLTGFHCVSKCDKKSCPEGFEVYFPPGECCKCRRRPVCRADMVLSGCACPKSCSNQTAVCDITTCKRGCMCPHGRYDDGTRCVTTDGCPCVDARGIVHKANSQWTSGECEICKCKGGRISCGKICKFNKCPDGFVLTTPKDACCACIAHATTRPPSTHPTTLTTTFTTPSTNHSVVGCRPHEYRQIYTDVEGCSAVITRSECTGGCESLVVSDLALGPAIKDCNCCRPSTTYRVNTILDCVDGRQKSMSFTKFTSCVCMACDKSPFDDLPLLN